jgi:hypothetical protein
MRVWPTNPIVRKERAAHGMGVGEDEGVDLAELLLGPPLDGARVERLAALRAVSHCQHG